MMLTEDEIPEELLKDTKFFHFGTLSMTHEGVRAATKKAVNLREMLLFANAAASLITTRKGALRLMPDRREIESLM